MTDENKTFDVVIYRWERYVSHAEIPAPDAKTALNIARERDLDGDFDFAEYTGEAEAADYFIAWESGGRWSGPGYSVEYPHDIALKERERLGRMVEYMRHAESLISGFEDDLDQYGIPELLANIRAEIAEAEKLINPGPVYAL